MDRQFHGFPKADTTGSSSCSGSPHTARPQARQPPLGPSSMELPNRHSNWVADWLSPFLQLDLPSIRSTDTKSPTKKNAAAVPSSSRDKVQRILLSGPNWRNSGSETGQKEPPHLYVDIETLAADEEEDAECEPWQELLHGEEKEEALDSSGKAIWGAGRLLLRALSPSGVLSGYHRALAEYRPRHSRRTRTTNIVELGCGTGLGGLSLAALLRDTMNQGHQARSDQQVRVVLTDGCPVAVRLAGRNAERWASPATTAFPGTTAANARVSVEARQLRWGGIAAKSTGSGAAKAELLLHDIIGTDLLLCTDLAYDAAHYVSLMATILTLLAAVEGGVPSPDEPEPEPDRNFRKNEFEVQSTAGDFSSALFWERDILGRLGLLLEGAEGKDDNVAASGGRRRPCGSSSRNRAKNILPPGPPKYMLFAMRKRSREEAALLHILGMYFRFRLVDVCRTDRQKKGLPTLLYVCELRRKHEGIKESRELKMEVVEDSSLFSDSSGGVHLHDQEGEIRRRNKCKSLHFCARKVVQSAVLEEIANAECELASSSADSDSDTATTSSDEDESDEKSLHEHSHANIATISHVDERRSSRPARARGARVYKDWLTRGRYDPQWQTITGCH